MGSREEDRELPAKLLAAYRRELELHSLIRYITPQLESLAKACERNWQIQTALMIIALINTNDPDLAKALAEATHVPVKALNVVVPVLLTYLFMRLGYLIN